MITPADLHGLPVGLLAPIVLISSLFLYWIISGIYHTFFGPLARVPGPKLWAFTRLPWIYHVFRGDFHNKLREFHDHYGPAVRYTWKDISFTSSDAIKKIHGHKSGGEHPFEKDATFYKTNKDTHIINADREDHRRMRRLLSHAFSEKALRGQEGVMKDYIDKLISKLTTFSRANQPMDIVRYYNFTTFDLIGDLAFGEPFGCLDGEGYHPWVKLLFDSIKGGAFRHVVMTLGLGSVMDALMPTKFRKAIADHMSLSRNLALKRLRSQNMEKEDFTSHILRHNDKKGMTEEEIAGNAGVLIVAGSETTATLLSGVTYQLLKNPAIYEKLAQEVRSSFQSVDDITLGQVNQLPYLIAVLTEGFRMYPPVPSALPRNVPAGGETVEGYWLPENTGVSTPHWPAFRSALNFRDPDEFVPSRWMDDPRYVNDDKAALKPFSFGPRDCIGKNLAYAEMRLILARMIWHFDLELMPESDSWDSQNVFLLWQKPDLNIKLTEVAR